MGLFQKTAADREEKVLKDELKSDERSIKQAMKEVERANKAELKAAKDAHAAIDDHQKSVRRVDKIAADIIKLQNEQQIAITSRDSLERQIDVKREEHIRMQQETIDAKARLEILQAQIGSKTVSRQERLNEMAAPVEAVPATRVTYVGERAIEGSPESGSLEADGARTVPVRSETVEYGVTNPSGVSTTVTTTRTQPLGEAELAAARNSPVRSPIAESRETWTNAAVSGTGTGTRVTDKVTRATRTSSIGGERDITTTRSSRITPGGAAEADVTTSRFDANGGEISSTHVTGMKEKSMGGGLTERDYARTSTERDSRDGTTWTERETTTTRSGAGMGSGELPAYRTGGSLDNARTSGSFDNNRTTGVSSISEDITTTRTGTGTTGGRYEKDTTTRFATDGGRYEKDTATTGRTGYGTGTDSTLPGSYERDTTTTSKYGPGGGRYEKETSTVTRTVPVLNTGIPSPRFVREASDTYLHVIPPNAGIAQPAIDSPGRLGMERNFSAGLAA